MYLTRLYITYYHISYFPFTGLKMSSYSLLCSSQCSNSDLELFVYSLFDHLSTSIETGLEDLCGGLTLFGLQVLTKLLYPSPSSAGQGEEDKMKMNSWVEIKAI